MISEKDFMNWKQDAVTEAFFGVIKDRVDEAMYILSRSAGINPNDDNFYRGMILAFRDVLETSFEETQENA